MQIMNNLMTLDSIGQAESKPDQPLKKNDASDEEAFEAQMSQLGAFFQMPAVQPQSKDFSVSKTPAVTSQTTNTQGLKMEDLLQSMNPLSSMKKEGLVLKTLQKNPEKSAFNEGMSISPGTDATFAGLVPSGAMNLSSESLKSKLQNSMSSDQRGEMVQGEALEGIELLRAMEKDQVGSLTHLEKPKSLEQPSNQLSGSQAMNLANSASWGPGVIESTNLKDKSKPGVEKGLQNGLSGGEFLQALSLVKKGDVQTQNQTGSQSQFQSENGNLFEQKLEKAEPKKKSAQLDKQVHFPIQGARLETSPKPTIEVSASVIPGAMAKPRLSTEALMGISSGIQNLTPQGGGEMKIRLKPDHLGELSVRVMTHGNHVGLQIQASDDKAKKILEESISHLKESLSAQNLTLGQLDVTVAPQIQNSNGSDLGNSSNHSQNFSGFQGDFGQSMNQQQGWQGSGQGSENQTNSQWNQRASGGLASNRSWVGSSPSQNQTGSSRLDVRA